MVVLALIIPSIEYAIEKKINFFQIRSQWYNNLFFSSLTTLKNYNLTTICQIKGIKIFFYTLIFFILSVITKLFYTFFIFCNLLLTVLSIYHYFFTSILENIFHYSDKYTSRFKKQNTWFSFFIYTGIKSFFNLRLAFMIFDLFFKGSLYWVYKKIETKILAVFAYYYKRSLTGHFFHFKVF